jgi:hypothetical protein
MKTTALLILMCCLGMMLAGVASVAADEPDESAVSEPTSPETAERVVTDDPLSFGQQLYEAVKSKDYWYAAGLVLALLTLGFRRLVVKRVDWFDTSRGGLAAVGITTLLATLAVALIARTAPSVDLFTGAALAAVAAMGGYTGLRRLLWPKKA